MNRNAVWLLIAAALVLLPLVSLQAQAGERSCGRSCTEMAGCCGDDGACCSACKCEKHECCGERPCNLWGHPGPMGPRGKEFYQEMKLQGRIDRELALCGCQQTSLSHAYDANNKIERELVHRYFTDRRVGIEQLNWQLTQLHNRIDWYTRGQLTPLQDAVFPEHEWFNYSMDSWNTGFHPGVDYVMDELGGKERKHYRRMRRHHEPED